MTSENIAMTAEAGASSAAVDDRFLNEFAARAQAEGLQLTGEGGLLQQLTKRLLESALHAGRQDWYKIAKALKPVYTAPTEDAATSRFLEFCEEWGPKHPAIVRLWENAWAESVPFLQFDTEIRRIVCTTNANESVNARIHRAVRARDHFPSENAALKCVHLAVMSLDPTGAGRKRWTTRWKRALQAFDITFDGRLTNNRIRPTNQPRLHRLLDRPISPE